MSKKDTAISGGKSSNMKSDVGIFVEAARSDNLPSTDFYQVKEAIGPLNRKVKMEVLQYEIPLAANEVINLGFIL